MQRKPQISSLNGSVFLVPEHKPSPSLGVAVGLWIWATLSGMLGASAIAEPTSDSRAVVPTTARYPQQLQRPLIFDWHVDTLFQLTRRWYDLRHKQPHRDLDLPRMKQGGLGAQVFSLWVPPRVMKKPGGGWRYLNRMVETFRKVLRYSGGMLVQARTAEDVRRIQRQGKIAALLGLEGVHPLEGQLDRVPILAQWGVVYVGLTWNNSNAFATSALDELRAKGRPLRGLTALGQKLVRLLEKHRILVDVSHAGQQTFWDVAKMAKRPWIASHSNAYRLCPHFRNLRDRQLKAIAKAGGVIGINFYTLFLRSGKQHHRATLQDVVRHIQYMVRVVGIEHVALGSDFDGITSRPQGLEHVGQLPRLIRTLQHHGFSSSQIRKILGENSLRVLPQK